MPRMVKMWIYSMIFSAMVGGMWWGVTTFYKPKKSEPQAPIVVSADEITRAYVADPIAAEALYSDKIVEITGIVSIGESGDEMYTLFLNGYIYDVECGFFDDVDIMNAELLIPGDVVTLTGKVVGVSMIYIILYDCSILSVD